MTYRNYKNFEVFMFLVKNNIQLTSENNGLEFDRFKTGLDKAIQGHAPMKKRYVRANQASFRDKKIKK